MPYITNKKRAHLAKQTSQSYALRKIIMSITVASLIVLVVFAILAIVNFAEVINTYSSNPTANPGPDDPASYLVWDLAHSTFGFLKLSGTRESFTIEGLSGFGWFMSVWTVITIALSVVSLVLMLTMKSPKSVKKGINTMQGAALSGKKLAAHANATQVYRERATNPKKLKKGQVSK